MKNFLYLLLCLTLVKCSSTETQERHIVFTNKVVVDALDQPTEQHLPYSPFERDTVSLGANSNRIYLFHVSSQWWVSINNGYTGSIPNLGQLDSSIFDQLFNSDRDTTFLFWDENAPYSLTFDIKKKLESSPITCTENLFYVSQISNFNTVTGFYQHIRYDYPDRPIEPVNTINYTFFSCDSSGNLLMKDQNILTNDGLEDTLKTICSKRIVDTAYCSRRLAYIRQFLGDERYESFNFADSCLQWESILRFCQLSNEGRIYLPKSRFTPVLVDFKETNTYAQFITVVGRIKQLHSKVITDLQLGISFDQLSAQEKALYDAVFSDQFEEPGFNWFFKPEKIPHPIEIIE